METCVSPGAHAHAGEEADHVLPGAHAHAHTHTHTQVRGPMGAHNKHINDRGVAVQPHVVLQYNHTWCCSTTRRSGKQWLLLFETYEYEYEYEY